MSQLVVHAEKLIARPLAVVQSQFVDMAHHARTGVHSTLAVSNVRPTDSGALFTGRRRMLGMMQVDEMEVSRDADGNSVLRGIAGPNAGFLVHQRFEARGPGQTLVRLQVEMPLRGAQKLFAPLIRIGIARDLALALEEDRRDLEDRAYGAS